MEEHTSEEPVLHTDYHSSDAKNANIEQELIDSKAQLRQVIDLIPEFIYARDYEGRFLLVNELAASHMNSTPQALEGRHYLQVDANNDLKADHLIEDRRVMDSNVPMEIPLERFTFAGNVVKYVRTIKVPFVTNTSSRKGVLCVSSDVTKFVNISHLKDNYIRQLEELAFTNSHVVRQPITTMLGLIQLIEDNAISADELREILGELGAQIKSLEEKTRDMSTTINQFRAKLDQHPDM